MTLTAAATAASLVAAAACSPATQQPGSSDTEAPTGLQAVYDAVAGLGPAERQAKLVELAKAETGALTCYCSINADDLIKISPELDKLLGTTGTLEHYQANANTVLQRVMQENEANQLGAGVIMLEAQQMQVIDDAGILAPLDTPITADIPNTEPNWAPYLVLAYVAFWNTDLISEADAPRTWEDVLTKYGDRLMLENQDVAWFYTLVTDYFVAEKGMTQDAAIQMFRDAGAVAGATDGHTALVNFVETGEFAVGSSGFSYRVGREEASGQPITYTKPQVVQPVVTEAVGIAIPRTTARPATAVLFADLVLGQIGQQILSDLGYTPANTSIDSPAKLPEGTITLPVDEAALNEVRTEWEDLYASVFQQ